MINAELLKILLQAVALANKPKSAEFVPPGHFYSAIADMQDIRRREATIFPPPPRTLAGIDLREEQQMALMQEFAAYYQELPFTATKQPNARYFFENPMYAYSDAIFLYCMLRHARPQQIVEVGSGYSSCATLDVNDRFFAGNITCTFIEPYPQTLQQLLAPEDLHKHHLVQSALQDVPLSMFTNLQANDILFIDSTHVSKVGSDVNYILFEILPRLNPGVYVHFHDIFYPFEYPKPWVYAGRAWNEAYMLRCFLSGNAAFAIVAFNTFLETFHREFFAERMPLCLNNLGGSLWLRRTA